MTSKKWQVFRAIFLIIYHCRDLGQFIRNVLSQVPPSLDKFSRSYEPKSKQKDNVKIHHRKFQIGFDVDVFLNFCPPKI